MLKKFFIGTVFFLFAATQFNFANAMSRSEMYLGGLTIGSSVEEMKRIYGEPTSHEGRTRGAFKYGNDAAIHYAPTRDSRTRELRAVIREITVSANNGWTTPSGLAVGDDISKALDMYGNPDYVQDGNFKTAYCYFHEYINDKYIDFGFIILFNNDSEKILELRLLAGQPRISRFDEIYQKVMKEMVE